MLADRAPHGHARKEAAISADDSAYRERIHRLRRVCEGLLGIPATEGNRVDVLRNGVEIFPAMLEAIGEAEQTVDLLSYVYWTGDIATSFAEACCQRARAGVRVRILLDAIGAARMRDELIDQLEDAGCTVEWFRPPATWKLWETNHRTHRKVLICDESTAFIGGVGIAEEWEGDAQDPRHWRETHFRVRGPAVDGLRAAFASNWAETGQPLFTDADRFPDQPYVGEAVVQMIRGEGETGWTDLWTVFRVLLQVAQERLRITTAYFAPDPTLQHLLCEASERGVDVQVLVPGPHVDKPVAQWSGQDSYRPLMDAGVRIWQYQPTMLHTKVLSVDGLLALVGSANFDRRSTYLNEEANLVILDPDVTRVLDAHFDDDIEDAKLVDPKEWVGRGPVQRSKEAVSRMFDPQL